MKHARLHRRLHLVADSMIQIRDALNEQDRPALRRGLRALKNNSAVALRLGTKVLRAYR